MSRLINILITIALGSLLIAIIGWFFKLSVLYIISMIIFAGALVLPVIIEIWNAGSSRSCGVRWEGGGVPGVYTIDAHRCILERGHGGSHMCHCRAKKKEGKVD